SGFGPVRTSSSFVLLPDRASTSALESMPQPRVHFVARLLKGVSPAPISVVVAASSLRAPPSIPKPTIASVSRVHTKDAAFFADFS
ncbi:hypothetical protein SPRG_12827, partial [Saprolegnia parasitica CBS 223.65]